MELDAFREIIRERTGLVFGENQTSRLAEAVSAMMSALGLESELRYYRLILGDRSAFLNLVDRLTINETYFYREPTHLKLLTDLILPELAGKKRFTGKVRLFSAGCSSGEEPYSLLMAVMEKYGPGAAGLYEVFGADIDRQALASARRGVYGGRSFRKLDDGLREKYFDRVDSSLYRVKEFVRRSVVFLELNLLEDAYPPEFQGMDVIFYRNVSIYFDEDSKSKIFRNLSRLLAPGGYLFVSSTETMSHDTNVLQLVQMGGAFVYCNTEAPIAGRATVDAVRKTAESVAAPVRREARKPAAKEPTTERRTRREAVRVRPEEPRKIVDEVLALARSERYEAALERLDELLAVEPNRASALALRGNLLMHCGRNEEARECCLRATDADPLNPEAYLLLGLIAANTGAIEEAVRRLRETLYLHSSCRLAHYRLARLHEETGNFEKSRRRYKILLGLLEHGGSPDPGLSFFSLFMTDGQLIRFCREKLARTGERP